MLRRLKKELASKPASSLHDANADADVDMDVNANANADGNAASSDTPAWCSPKTPKPIKTYGRKRPYRSGLEDTTNTMFEQREDDAGTLSPNPIKTYGRKRQILSGLEDTTDTMDEKVEDDAGNPNPDDLLSIRVKSTVAANQFNVLANSKEKRVARRGETRLNSPMLRTPILQARKPESELSPRAQAAKAREELRVKHRAQDEAIKEDDRAEKEFEAERRRLYADLRQAREEGWVKLSIERDMFRDSQPEEGGSRAKRRRRNVESIEEVIRQLEEDRDRAWWEFYRSLEGLSFAEKVEMRNLKREKGITEMYYRWNKNAALRQGMTSAAGCLYCIVDDCQGC